MEKYKLNTKIGQVVNHIEINIRADSDKNDTTSLYKEGIYIENLKIVYQTYHKIALDDTWITLLDRKKIDYRKERFYTYLEDCIVSIKTNETYFPNGVFGTIYTIGNTKTAIRKLGKAIEKEVNSRYGFLSKINVKELIDEYLENNK
jgi:hypothetical protein